ncbi:sialate O-acetylesterase [Maricaulis sp. D1M11]|uniref:sialate O-acetylesterase n=1 Tax=Maricaulis sp. D1M11 TaxID=3076117 RepID=UPI0039B46BA5
MRTLILATGLLLAACAEPTMQNEEPTVFKAYFLGGQSNMDGYGYITDLTASQSAPVDTVYIFAGASAGDGETGAGRGLWTPLTPGFGTGFTSNGVSNQLSDRFGPELSFGHTLGAQSDAPIALIKYSRGGTSLADNSGYGDWYPEGGGADDLNQYDFALATIRAALLDRDIDGDGRVDRLEPAGIIWMQGEADAYASPQSAAAYEANLDRMMDLLRAALHTDDLPVVIGRISDSGMDEDGQVMTYIETVLAAQESWVEGDDCAAYVRDIETYAHSDDAWHYLSEGYWRMGIAFADAVTQLETECGR